MPRVIANLLLSLLLIPLGIILYTAMYAIVDEDRWFYADEMQYIVVGGATWIIAATYWLFVWVRHVNWTTARRWHMATAVAVALVAAIGVATAIERWDRGFGNFMGSVTAPLVWLIATMFIWRESMRERRQRLARSSAGDVVCPSCNYNMTGLSEARCPECGTQFTLNELVAGQPARQAAEVERL